MAKVKNRFIGRHSLWLDCDVNLSQEQSKPFVKVNAPQLRRGKPLLEWLCGFALPRGGLQAWSKTPIAPT
jgi:hypothetical protein